MVSRVYNNSLRPVVVVTGLITAGWTLVWGISSLQEINVDQSHGFPKFSTLAIALGALYLTVMVLELFGVIAATMQTLILVRLFSFASILSGLIVVGAGFLRTVVHFLYKNDLISECQQLAQGQDVAIRFGLWGPTIQDRLSPQDAEDFCKNWWSHDSFSEIISLIIEIILAGVFISIAFAYYHQCNDPTFSRSRDPPARTDDFPTHYNPPYVSYNPTSYAPPDGPPPAFKEPPEYERGGYGVGNALDKGGESTDALERDLKGDDPFADFDGPSHGKPGESRDTLV